MKQGLFFLSDCLTDSNHAKAQLKYELKQLESTLAQHVTVIGRVLCCPPEIKQLCELLLTKYCNYLQLLDVTIADDFFSTLKNENHWLDDYQKLVQLKKQLSHVTALDEQKSLITTIVSLYFCIKESSLDVDCEHIANVETEGLYQLFASADLKLWLLGLIGLWNQSSVKDPKIINAIHQWSIEQQQYALDFLCAFECIQFINTIFFYKLYPEQLFDGGSHPEKLISLRARLEFLHHNIEQIQQQLFQAAEKNGLEYQVDYLLHHDTLPSGIKFEINEHYKSLIQEAVKQVNRPQSSQLNTMSVLHDLLTAYKYWFNPNRLIDTVMLLKQGRAESFDDLLSYLYQQLTTTECLDLYGYFSNKDTKYLLRALHLTINEPQSLTWLHCLNEKNKQTIAEVLSSLTSVMEAVRIELSNRAISTVAYDYETETSSIEIGRRNRNAVLRVLEVYSVTEESINQTVEQLFQAIEYLHNQPNDG